MTSRGPTRLLGNDVGPLRIRTKLSKGYALPRLLADEENMALEPLRVRGAQAPLTDNAHRAIR